MNYTVNIDWRFIVALGVAPAFIILASKIDAEAAERVLAQAVNAYGMGTYAITGNC